MLRWRRALLLVFVFVSVFVTAAFAAPARAQGQQPPPSGPPQQQQQQQQQPTLADPRPAAVALAYEAAALLELGALRSPGADRVAAVLGERRSSLVPPGADVGNALIAADDAARRELVAAGNANLTPDVRTTLDVLSAADRQAALQRQPISIDPELYVRSFAQLLQYNGGPPPQMEPPNIPEVARRLAAALEGAVPPPTTPAGSAPQVLDGDDAAAPVDAGGDDGSGGGGMPLLVIGALVLAGIGVGIGLSMRRRAFGGGGGGGSTTAAAPSTTPRIDAPAAAMQDLLEVSRRLTTAASTGDIDRAVVRSALDLVHADGAALIRNAGGSLTVGAETAPGLMVPEALAEGAIGRVAETGQTLVQVSATERAVRRLPVALAVVPLVGGGRVTAVLALMRPEQRPFSPHERDVLNALAPVAAAALQSAEQAKAAIEDSLVDALTGVGNRRRFEADLAAALASASESTSADGDHPVSLFIVDLDRFKAVNDTYGHPAGDALLAGVAGVMRDMVRPSDAVYRFGGEEFCVLLRDTPLDEAIVVAERVRAAIAESSFDVGAGAGGGSALSATASFGVACAGAAGGDAAGLLARADAALYESKANGRNRVTAA